MITIDQIMLVDKEMKDNKFHYEVTKDMRNELISKAINERSISARKLAKIFNCSTAAIYARMHTSSIKFKLA